MQSFLVFFQRYCFSKEQLPADIDSALKECLNNCLPKRKQLTCLQEAEEAVSQLRMQQLKRYATAKGIALEDVQQMFGGDGVSVEFSEIDGEDEEVDDDDDDGNDEEIASKRNNSSNENSSSRRMKGHNAAGNIRL